MNFDKENSNEGAARPLIVCRAGAYSSILGGSGNTIAGAHTFAAIFGQNLNSAAANTFHVECLNAINTPLYFAGMPSGAIGYKDFANLANGDRVLVIHP